ncbi:MAG: lysylphosphatidylglycerol synthase transmembrane domain-containing protein [Armatimonadota bacterium]|nr:lysylphosphatidylglycerol synthase transmembrane domain-containing protein [Armatimonadota bacterium]
MSFLISFPTLLLKGILTLIALWLLGRFVSPLRVLEVLMHANFLPLLLAVSLAWGFAVLKAIKWGLLIRASAVPVGMSVAFRSYFLGMAVGLLTPGRVGEVARIACLPRERRLALGSLVAFDKSMDAWAIAALALLGVNALFGPRLALLVALGLFVWGFLTLYPGWTVAVLRRRGAIPRLLPWSSQVDQRSLRTAFGLTVVAFATITAEAVFIAQAFHPAAELPVVLTLPAILVANSLPITLGGLGVREGVAVFLMGRFGVSPEAATLVAFTLFVFNTFFPALLGFLVASREASRQENLNTARQA